MFVGLKYLKKVVLSPPKSGFEVKQNYQMIPCLVAGKKVCSNFFFFFKSKEGCKEKIHMGKEKKRGETRGQCQLDPSLQGGMEKPGSGRWIGVNSPRERGKYSLSGNLKQS